MQPQPPPDVVFPNLPLVVERILGKGSGMMFQVLMETI